MLPSVGEPQVKKEFVRRAPRARCSGMFWNLNDVRRALFGNVRECSRITQMGDVGRAPFSMFRNVLECSRMFRASLALFENVRKCSFVVSISFGIVLDLPLWGDFVVGRKVFVHTFKFIPVGTGCQSIVSEDPLVKVLILVGEDATARLSRV